jgi:hypothetical protein
MRSSPTSGPPSDYYAFVPFIYNLDLNFSDFQLYINVNDRFKVDPELDRILFRLVLVQWNHDIRRQALAFDDNGE